MFNSKTDSVTRGNRYKLLLGQVSYTTYDLRKSFFFKSYIICMEQLI
jgi:hypothetical protein